MRSAAGWTPLWSAGKRRRDDPLLTARPPGSRTPLRIVLDTSASLPSESQLVRTAGETPVLIAAGSEASAADCRRLREAGCEVFVAPAATYAARLDALLEELGKRQLTNVLVEGGGRVLGGFLDLRQIDELHVFIAPKLFGGAGAPSPIAGAGAAELAAAIGLGEWTVETLGGDVCVRGRTR